MGDNQEVLTLVESSVDLDEVGPGLCRIQYRKGQGLVLKRFGKAAENILIAEEQDPQDAILKLEKGAPNGVATLDAGALVPVAQIPPLGGSLPLTTLGDTLYHNGAASVRLAGNITTTRKFLRQTGTGAVSAAPAWDTILAADVPASALTKIDDTNVTLTLGGSPATALLAAASLTLGWTGTLSIARGGTGAATALDAFNALSPLTTKGDLLSRDGANNVRLAVGADGLFLAADSTQASGLKWIAAPGGIGGGGNSPQVAYFSALDTLTGSAGLRYTGGSFFAGSTAAAGTSEIFVGADATGNRVSHLTLVGDDTNPYAVRLIRTGAGVNADTNLLHRGTGKLIVNVEDAGTFQLKVNGILKYQVIADNNSSFWTATYDFGGTAANLTAGLNVGNHSSGDRIAHLSLIGDDTFTVYGTRLIRQAGANANTDLLHRGTGQLRLVAEDAGSIYALVNGNVNFAILATQIFSFVGSTFFGSQTANATSEVRIGTKSSGDRISHVSLMAHGAADAIDYDARLIRNAGVNGTTDLRHKGAGALQFVSEDSGPILNFIGINEKTRVTAVGLGVLTAGDPEQPLDVRGEISIFGASSALARLRLRGFYAASPADPPADQTDMIVVDNGITQVFRVRYNKGGVMKVGDLALA